MQNLASYHLIIQFNILICFGGLDKPRFSKYAMEYEIFIWKSNKILD